MYILGIETSCDETAVAVTKDNKIMANSVSSSAHLHKNFGGVIPEIASRYHVEYINYVFKDALSKAGIELDEIGLIAATVKPGLAGALLVGVSMAKALSLAKGIPLVCVDHVRAHLYAVFMHDGTSRDGRKKIDIPRFPFVGLVVSGGHTNLFRVKDVNKYNLLGQTLDDAAGEAFDKVSKLLNLGYPGGPIIEKRAKFGRIDKRLFPRSLSSEELNFSFSGLKTSVLYHIQRRLKEKKLFRRGKKGNVERVTAASMLERSEIDDIAASFQDTVTEVLTEKAIAACKKEKINRLVIGGGVSANTELRDKLSRRSLEDGIRLFLPPKGLCLDNAAMVAGLGAAIYKKRRGCF